MSKTRVVLLTIVAALASVCAVPARAQLLPLPFKTKSKPTRTATPTPAITATPIATATPVDTATRTPSPIPPTGTPNRSPTAPPTVARTTTPTALRTATRTPTPVATSGPLPDMVAEISDVALALDTTAASGDVAEGCAEATSGVDLLRFSATSRNIGTADLVLGDPQCPSPCSDHPLEVCGNPDYICSPAAGHNHPHYINYARYELLDQSGTAVVVGHKQGYCLRDTNCASPVYTCTYQGISAGCADTYSSSLGCQYLDVTGVPAGDYVLRVTIDPLNKIAELSDANNVTQQSVTIARPGEATATPVRTGTPARTATPLQTATPARTATPVTSPTAVATSTSVPTSIATATRTATPGAGATRTPTPVESATAASTASPPRPSPTASPGAPDGGVLAACQLEILKSGRTLVGRTFAALDDCGSAVAACEAPRRRTSACREHATGVCGDVGDRIDVLRATFADRVHARCAALGDAGWVAGSGLGYARRPAECDAGGDVAALVACVAHEHVCRAGASAETEEARTGARLARGGLAGGDVCVDDLGGADPDAPDAADAHAFDGCTRAVRLAGRRFLRHRMTTLQGCVAAHASCLKATSGAEACEARAIEACNARIARLADDPARFIATVDRGCHGVDFAALRAADGGNVAALASRCADLGVPALDSLAAYEQCILREHACAVDTLLASEAPRSTEWLTASPAPGGHCPGSSD